MYFTVAIKQCQSCKVDRKITDGNRTGHPEFIGRNEDTCYQCQVLDEQGAVIVADVVAMLNETA